MSKRIIITIILMLLITTVMIYHELKDSNDLGSENQGICASSCRSDGYTYGEYLGWQRCNCWNETIIENEIN